MENKLRITLTVSDAKMQVIGKENEGFIGTITALGSLAETLNTLGLDMKHDMDMDGNVTVTIEYPYEYEARRFAKRGGAYKKGVPYNSPLRGLKEEEQYEWLEAHSAKEGAKALGVTERTYFRRMATLRERYSGE